MNTVPRTTAKEIPILDSQLSQIDKRISELFSIKDRIQDSVGRLLDPRPADAGQAAPAQPESITVEAKLRSISNRLDLLRGDYAGIASMLDSGI